MSAASSHILGASYAEPRDSFHASLVLSEGVTAHINAPTIGELQAVVAKLQTAANDAKPAAPKVEPAGNAPAPTGAPASAPAAASGSESADAPRPTYDDVKARVLKLAKVSRDTATDALKKFGVDHGNKLKLEQYPEFLKHADAVLAKAGNA